jgi:hypothetical protein
VLYIKFGIELMKGAALTCTTGEVELTAGQVEELLKEELYLSISTLGQEQALRGRLLTHLALPTDMTGSSCLRSASGRSTSPSFQDFYLETK